MPTSGENTLQESVEILVSLFERMERFESDD